LKPIETVLFDLDGTLIDSRLDLAQAVNQALSTLGLPVQTESQITPHVGNGLRVLLSDVIGQPTPSMLDRAEAAFSEYYEAHCTDLTVLYDDVQAVLSNLAPQKKFAVVTNKPERFAVKIVKKLGLADLLPVIVGGDTLPERKPHPAPVLKALADLKADPATAMMVGDGPQDILAGQSAGVATCIVEFGYGFRMESLALNPTFKIRRFSELKEIVL
jgi:phosphoglycolate phosphatase